MASRHAAIPKSIVKNAQTITPPPAYNNQSNMSAPNPNNLQVSVSRQGGDDSDEEDEEEDAKNLSEIQITINTPLVISGDHNLIAVDPALNATKVAAGVVSALKTMSMSGHGVPMIDEDGRPRPISVIVQADIKVEGGKNLVGEAAVLNAIVPMLKEAEAKAFEAQHLREVIEGEKRGRERSESSERCPKRARVE